MVGKNISNSSITNCSATGSVTSNGTGGNAGGLVGNSIGASTITNSFSTGDVTGNISGGLGIGGLIGRSGITNQPFPSSTITNCYATGAVTGHERTGGLAGMAYLSKIVNSYATRAVTGGKNTGGFGGYIPGGTTIENSYSTGAVSGAELTGGFIGLAGGTVKYSYSTGAVTGTSARKDGFIGKAGASTTIENNYFDTSMSGLGVGIENDPTNPAVIGIVIADIIGGGSEPFETNGWDFAAIWSAQGDNVWPLLISP